ncbi:DGQHR domain-containing protein [Parasphingorhabdus sp.]|uniref:DGQHR domain-containing protein n=1 Tax=Parasphingorhabdus sp. TaxID=2709688 RepID=UPI003296B5DB
MTSERVQLIKVRQWLAEWERVQWREGLERPKENFYVGSISLEKLRKLAGVTTRDVSQRGDPDSIQGYQRMHEENQSKKINRFVHFGYPLSTSQNLVPSQHEHLINPGWLPNAIIVNVIPSGSQRVKGGRNAVVPKDLEVSIGEDQYGSHLNIPSESEIDKLQKSGSVFVEPIEIIDGQHRLFASDYGEKFGNDYQVPIVVFDNLSLGWQAYLFWTINVEPKKINASLAFDLYPELRRQEWLEQSETIKIYQEHRSQEMAEALWSHPQSPWKGRIELHGRRKRGHVSNAAFIRSLNSSFIKKWNRGERVGGLFGSIPNSDGSSTKVIPWKRSQQAAFLIQVWRSISKSVNKSQAEWKLAISRSAQGQLLDDFSPAFSGENTLLATDQGVRAVHNIFNAIFQDIPEKLDLMSWYAGDALLEKPTEESIDYALKSFQNMGKANEIIEQISEAIVNGFDWRLSSAPGLGDKEKKVQSAYKGSGGYSLMMKELLKVLGSDENVDSMIQDAANDVAATLIKS